MSRRLSPVLAVLLVVALGGGPAVALATPAPRTSLPAIEPEVMCVVCKLPLNVAQSPQADRERAFIQALIDRGEGVTQIKRALVAQYGPEVLSTPSTSGFGLVAYIVPAVVVAFVALLAVLLLRRWRRRSATSSAEPAAVVSGEDRARVDAELARFRG